MLDNRGFITGHCEIRLLRRVCNTWQSHYCRVYCDEEELETVEHLFCNCAALSKFELRTLGGGFFEDLNSVSRADIKSINRFISGLR